jgi:hypothetical protein
VFELKVLADNDFDIIKRTLGSLSAKTFNSNTDELNLLKLI